MDQNSSQSQNQQSNTASVPQPTYQSQQSDVSAPPVGIQPVGGPREQGPSSQMNASEIVIPTEVEPVVSPEVKEAGVITVPNQEQIHVSPELKNAGVAAVKTAVPVQTTPSYSIQLPITEEEAKKNIKIHPVFDSARWLSTQILEQFKKMHKAVKPK